MTNSNTNKILITGSKSGFGKQLSEWIDNAHCLKEEKDLNSKKNTDFDIVIHCAATSSRKFSDIFKLIKNNIFLTYKLLKLNSKTFVFFSSVDVNNKEFNLFSISKFICEILIKIFHKNYLIYRPSIMLGKYMRKNHVSKILSSENIQLSLAEDSTFRYVSHKKMYEQIMKDISECNKGVFNLTSSNPKELKYYVDKFSKSNVSYGNYKYDTILSSKYPTVYLGDSESNFVFYINEK